MEQLKERNGCKLQGILVTGEIIAKRASEFSIIKMATSTKDCGLKTKDMVKELIGEMKMEN